MIYLGFLVSYAKVQIVNQNYSIKSYLLLSTCSTKCLFLKKKKKNSAQFINIKVNLLISQLSFAVEAVFTLERILPQLSKIYIYLSLLHCFPTEEVVIIFNSIKIRVPPKIRVLLYPFMLKGFKAYTSSKHRMKHLAMRTLVISKKLKIKCAKV